METIDKQPAAPGDEAHCASDLLVAMKSAFGIETPEGLFSSFVKIAESWISGGYSYSFILRHPTQSSLIEKIDRKTISSITPSVRIMTLAISLAYSHNFGDICRMVHTANEIDRIDNFENYTRIMRLLYPQAIKESSRAKIILALGLSPENDISRLYEEEFDFMSSFEESTAGPGERPKNLAYYEAKKFASLCYSLLTDGAMATMNGCESFGDFDKEEALSCFSQQSPQKKKLQMVC